MGDEGSVRAVDPDAPWRPGYDGPPLVGLDERAPPEPATVARGASVGVVGEPGPGRSGDEPSPWSRAAAERPPEPWRPIRAPRPVEPDPPDPEPSRVAAVEDAPASVVTGEVILTGLAVLVALALAFGVVVALAGRTGRTVVPADALVVPDRVDPRWSVRHDGTIADVEVGAGVVVVRLPDRLVAHDRDTGAERWSLPLVDGATGVDHRIVGDHVVVVKRLLDARESVAAHATSTGELQWERVADAAEVVRQAILVYEVGADARSAVRVLDPDTGEPVTGALPQGRVAAAPPHLATTTDDRVQLFDLDALETVGPSVAADELATIALVDDTVVGFDVNARIIAFDERGEPIDQRRFVSDVFGDFVGRAQMVGGVPGYDVGIVASGSSLGFAVVDGEIEPRWGLSGRVGGPVPTSVGPIGVARVVDDDTGEINFALVDARDGETIAVTDVGVTRESDPLAGWDAYVVAPEVGTRRRSLAAFDYDGDLRWSLDLPSAAVHAVVDGLVIVVERSPSGSSITVHG